MTKLAFPFLLLVAAAVIFFNFTDPVLKNIDELRLQRAELNQGLDNAQKLREVQQTLLDTYNSFKPEDVARLNRLLPDNVDNVRLIIDINHIAAPYNMQIKNINIAAAEGQTNESVIAVGAEPQLGSVTLSFGVSGPYQNFQSFVADLARSLRLVDITSFDLVSADKDFYDYNVSIKTYWLK